MSVPSLPACSSACCAAGSERSERACESAASAYLGQEWRRLQVTVLANWVTPEAEQMIASGFPDARRYGRRLKRRIENLYANWFGPGAFGCFVPRMASEL